MAQPGLLFVTVSALVFSAGPAQALGLEEVDPRALETLTHAVAEPVQTFRPILDPLGQLSPFLDIRPDGVFVRYSVAEPWRRLSPKAAPVVAARDPVPMKTIRGQPLAGLRIALDPGHRGGAWSETEERHVQVGPGPPVREGTLTYAVAVDLRRQLRRLGAEVMLTRGAPPKRDFPQELLPGYDPELEARQWIGELVHSRRFRHLARFARWPAAQWFERLIARTLVQLAPVKVYNRYELRRRSQLAEAFQPHVTLSLHFNVARDPLTNGVIVFLLGNFLHQELATRSQRFYALRALLSGDLPRAAAVAQTLGRALQQELNVPALSEPSDSPIGRAKKIPVAAEDGVFARNLALVRRTPGLVLLVEGPCMNAVGEFEKLQRTPRARTSAYARAVVRALVTQVALLRRP
ncbi:MAG: hypothetical protein AAFU77_09475 [Myxococcota bacterium]